MLFQAKSGAFGSGRAAGHASGCPDDPCAGAVARTNAARQHHSNSAFNGCRHHAQSGRQRCAARRSAGCPTRGLSHSALLVWVTAFLLLTYSAYSALSVAHQSWGAMLGGDEAQRSRIVAWREGFGLLGVLTASITPAVLGLPVTVAIFFMALGIGWLAWTRAVRPRPSPSFKTGSVWLPLKSPAFRRLLVVFILNGIASAIPATLILFFVQDRLQAPTSLEPAFFARQRVSLGIHLALANRWCKAWRRRAVPRRERPLGAEGCGSQPARAGWDSPKGLCLWQWQWHVQQRTRSGKRGRNNR